MTASAKRCPRCGQVKPAGQFYRRRHGRRLSPYCQSCQRAAARLARTPAPPGPGRGRAAAGG